MVPDPADHVTGADEPPVVAAVRFEPLLADELASRRAIADWSDGTTGEALRWYDDEVLFCEGDFIGKTTAQLRTLLFRRDRAFLSDS